MRSDSQSAQDIAPTQAMVAGFEFGLGVSRARHDLNNAIGQILGFSEMLLEEIQEQGREQLRPELELIHRYAGQMRSQTNETLQVAKIKAGRADLPSLQRRLCAHAARILSAVNRLAHKARSFADSVFKDDLARIGAAARYAQEATCAFPSALTQAGTGAAEPAQRPTNPLLPLLSSPKETPRITPTRHDGVVLVVDDLESNRELLTRRISRLGYSIQVAESGQSALEVIAAKPVDVILLDIVMPGMDGFEVLQRLKSDPVMRHIPVIMLSSADQIDVAVRCIKLGADDFLPKPFNPTLLTARLESCLSKKRLRDQETDFLQRLQAEQALSERLLLNILPKPIAERLKRGEKLIADSLAEVTVLFSDFINFTRFSDGIAPGALVGYLNEVFSAFDQLCEQHGLEKIKTIGDAYLAVGGLPAPLPTHAQAAAELALAMQQELACFARRQGLPLRMRVGLNSGPVVAGVIGTRKFAYDLWGDTVNLAYRMQAHAPPGGILVSAATHRHLHQIYAFKPGRLVRVKGKGEVLSYRLLGRQ
jgi:adenylate cyclase